MIADKTKCKITKVPGDGVYAHLLGQPVTVTENKGQRNTGTQQALLTNGIVYIGGDSGLEVEPAKA